MILNWIVYLLGVVMTLLLRELGGFIYRMGKSKLVELKQLRDEREARWIRVEEKVDGLIAGPYGPKNP